MADVCDPVRTTAETKAKPGNKYQYQPRYIEPATPGDEDLGPLKLLPGGWESKQQGWNMIALPFDTNTRSNFRVLMNQYRETLKFTLVDKGVPNRGIATGGGETVDTNQFLVTLDYEQVIHQIRVDYEPVVFLDFFPRVDGLPGLIRWPHVSINTLDKVIDSPVS